MTIRRSLLAGSALALAGVAMAFAQTPGSGPSADTTKLREELMALEKGSWDFMRDKNYEGMKNFLGEDALLIFGDGNRYNKRQTLELMKDFALLDLRIEPTYAVRMLSGDVATLLYRVTYTSTFKGGKPETMKVLSSSVYARRGGKWWSVLYQETPLK
ncbi:MAG TPA: nuclear transport factor 2 family protein [Reyranella sp.]|nr:nuclear transport factor 2 family protein [Reyranella sp.]